MITPSLVNIVGSIVKQTIKVTNGPTPNSHGYVTLSYDPNWTIIGSTLQKGSLVGNTWTIGSMNPGEVAVGEISFSLTSAPSVDTLFTFIAVVNADMDTITSNNSLQDKVQYKTLSCINDDPCADPTVPVIEITIPVKYEIPFKVPVKCDIGKTAFVLGDTDNVTVDIDPFTGEGILTPDDITLPYSFEVFTHCKTKCKTHVFGPHIVKGLGVCQPQVVAEDTEVEGTIAVERTIDLLFLTTFNSTCEPVTWNVVSDTSGTAIVSGSLITYTPQDNNESITWSATCANGTTIDEGVILISTPPVTLDLNDGTNNDIPCMIIN